MSDYIDSGVIRVTHQEVNFALASPLFLGRLSKACRDTVNI